MFSNEDAFMQLNKTKPKQQNRTKKKFSFNENEKIGSMTIANELKLTFIYKRKKKSTIISSHYNRTYKIKCIAFKRKNE